MAQGSRVGNKTKSVARQRCDRLKEKLKKFKGKLNAIDFFVPIGNKTIFLKKYRRTMTIMKIWLRSV